MRSIRTLLAAVATVTFAPAASAADIFPGNPTVVPGATFIVSGSPFEGPVSAAFGRSGLGSGTFTDRFLITLDFEALGSVSITSILAGLTGSETDLDFNSLTFDNGSSVFVVPFSDLGFQETGGLMNIPISFGSQNIFSINYTSRGAGSYGGTMVFVESIESPVPEPTTWAMMLLGFGAVGFAMRRRKQKLTVSYA